jgi:ubiquinone/menaquinone biosynthesis C-methylase UbiE
MTDAGFDREQYLKRQRTEWDQAAEGWLRWRHIFEQRTDDQPLLEAIGITPRDRVLDVGAGTGDPSLTLARRVGPEGSVVATDISEAMLAVARARAEEAELENIEFRVESAEELDFPAGSFDAAVCSFTLMLLANPVTVSERIRSFLRPGGRFAASVFGAPDKVPMMSIPAKIIFSELGVPPPPPYQPGLFALGDPARLVKVLREAGFSEVSATPIAMALRFDSADEFANFVRETVVVLRQVIEEDAPGRSEGTWKKVVAAARGHAASDGSVTFNNQVRIGVGTVLV